jgi:hypothetical protein
MKLKYYKHRAVIFEFHSSREAEDNATSRELWRWSRGIPSRGIEMLCELGKYEKQLFRKK